jgi:hypothetical protein
MITCKEHMSILEIDLYQIRLYEISVRWILQVRFVHSNMVMGDDNRKKEKVTMVKVFE